MTLLVTCDIDIGVVVREDGGERPHPPNKNTTVADFYFEKPLGVIEDVRGEKTQSERNHR